MTIFLYTMSTMLRIDFLCTNVAYCWTSRDDKVIFPPHLYFFTGDFRFLLHNYFLNIFISLYSESAGRFTVIYIYVLLV